MPNNKAFLHNNKNSVPNNINYVPNSKNHVSNNQKSDPNNKKLDPNNQKSHPNNKKKIILAGLAPHTKQPSQIIFHMVSLVIENSLAVSLDSGCIADSDV